VQKKQFQHCRDFDSREKVYDDISSMCYKHVEHVRTFYFHIFNRLILSEITLFAYKHELTNERKKEEEEEEAIML